MAVRQSRSSELMGYLHVLDSRRCGACSQLVASFGDLFAVEPFFCNGDTHGYHVLVAIYCVGDFTLLPV